MVLLAYVGVIAAAFAAVCRESILAMRLLWLLCSVGLQSLPMQLLGCLVVLACALCCVPGIYGIEPQCMQ
jgi:hypothetical protein